MVGVVAEVPAHGVGEGAEDASVAHAGLGPQERSGWSCRVIAEPCAANIPLPSTFLQELFGRSFQCKVAQIVYWGQKLET